MPPFSRSARLTASIVAICLGTTSCATIDDFSRSNSSATNCAVGGVIGALGGALAVAAAGKNDQGALVAGAAVGAVAGCGLALNYKKRLQRLEEVAKEENLKIELETLKTVGEKGGETAEAGIVAQVQDQGMFPVGSAALSPDGQRQVRKLASAFAGKPGEQGTSAILVVGHTDATGSAATNQALSERRARAVAGILAEQGIAKERMYFQGAGASRPVADNADPLQRGKNRRVEIVEVNDRETLVKRVNAEQNNMRYLEHGTATTAPAKSIRTASSSSARGKTERANPVKNGQPTQRKASHALVDFGGEPARDSEWSLAQAIKPKRTGLGLISSAYASDIPLGSCQSDNARLSGDVKSFATGASLNDHATREYLPGMNGRAWASLVNGHLVTLSPVAVLKDNATLVQNPKVYVTHDYADNKGKANDTLVATANTYEGEDAVLYRVFIDQPNQAPLSCIDVVMRKAGDKSLDGKLYYNNGGEPYTAAYAPVRG